MQFIRSRFPNNYGMIAKYENYWVDEYPKCSERYNFSGTTRMELKSL